jgi:hypothetical protein
MCPVVTRAWQAREVTDPRIEAFGDIVGDADLLVDADQRAGFEIDWTD